MTFRSALPPRFPLSITIGIDANARPLRMRSAALVAAFAPTLRMARRG